MPGKKQISELTRLTENMSLDEAQQVLELIIKDTDWNRITHPVAYVISRWDSFVRSKRAMQRDDADSSSDTSVDVAEVQRIKEQIQAEHEQSMKELKERQEAEAIAIANIDHWL